jgi:hypothetical protein
MAAQEVIESLMKLNKNVFVAPDVGVFYNRRTEIKDNWHKVCIYCVHNHTCLFQDNNDVWACEDVAEYDYFYTIRRKKKRSDNTTSREDKMKIGDKVKMSDKNPNHLGYGVDAYAGMEGIVTEIYNDGAFVLKCETSILVVPMSNTFNKPKKGVWIWLNGEHIFHKRIETKPKNLRSRLCKALRLKN